MPINETEYITKQLILEIMPDLKLWRVIDLDAFELCFDMGGGRFVCQQSNDAGYFAKLLYQNGHYPSIDRALQAITDKEGRK